jgi:hypothetical protein
MRFVLEKPLSTLQQRKLRAFVQKVALERNRPDLRSANLLKDDGALLCVALIACFLVGISRGQCEHFLDKLRVYRPDAVAALTYLNFLMEGPLFSDN